MSHWGWAPIPLLWQSFWMELGSLPPSHSSQSMSPRSWDDGRKDACDLPPHAVFSGDRERGLPGRAAAGPAFVVGGVYASAQMFMRDCQEVIYESPGPSPIKAVPSMF